MGQVQVSKAKVHSNQIIAIVEIVFAGILLFIFSMGVIAGITERIWGMFWSFLVFCVLGGLLLSCGVRRLNLHGKFQIYSFALSKIPDGSTLSLAQVLHRPEAEIFTDLDKLLYHKFFKNAVLDRVNRQLVLTGLQCPQRQENAQIPVETVTVTCSACGGVTEIPVQGKGKCQYCGSQLSALQTAKRV